MKKTETIVIDGVKYITSDAKLKVGDCYLFLDEETGMWGFGDMIKSERALNKLSPNTVRRKIISVTN